MDNNTSYHQEPITVRFQFGPEDAGYCRSCDKLVCFGIVDSDGRYLCGICGCALYFDDCHVENGGGGTDVSRSEVAAWITPGLVCWAALIVWLIWRLA